MPRDAEPLTDVLDAFGESGEGGSVAVGEVLEQFDNRSLGFLLTLWGLAAALPIIGDIPGASILLGSLILVAVAQTLIGRGSLWLPERVRRYEMSREKFERVIDRVRPWTRRVDKLLKPRLTQLSAGEANTRIVAVAAAFLAITFYPLAFVPFGVNVPALGVMALGLGLLACDGLMVLLGYGFAAATVIVLLNASLGGG
jgi:hypothetical protein